MASSFDRSLETRELITAAEEYALRRGPRRSPAYRAAWLEFRQRVRTVEDLRRGQNGPGGVNPKAVTVLHAAIERAMLIDKASMANARLVAPDRRTVRIVAQFGFTDHLLDVFEIVDYMSSPGGRMLAKGRAVWVPDPTRFKMFAGTPSLDVLLDAGIRAVASIPVTAPDGQLLGTISTHHTRPTSWTPRRKLQLQRIARSAGRILEHLVPTRHDESTREPAPAGWHELF